MIQADLTAVAPGPLESATARTLHLLADIESRGGATVYRFSPQSVRRALDAGWSVAEIHDFLPRRRPCPRPPTSDRVRTVGWIEDDDVGTCTAIVRVTSPLPVQCVVAVAADERVVTGATQNAVVPAATHQRVIVGLAVDRVVAGRRAERIIPVQESEQTVYRPQWKSETRDVVRTYHVPITEYRWEAYWQGRFNPFVQPYLAQRLVPSTRWETRTETVKLPTTSYSVVPEKSVVRTPVTTWKTIERQVTARVPVAGRIVASAAAANSPAAAVSPQATSAASAGQAYGSGSIYGGVARLDDGPPRQANNLGWRPAGATTIR